MGRFAGYVLMVVLACIAAFRPLPVSAQDDCVIGRGIACQTNANCAGFPDANMCVDGKCQSSCDDGRGNAVPAQCSLGETCVEGVSPGLGTRNYCKTGQFTMDLNLLDSCIYHFVEGLQPDLGSSDRCSLARNLSAMLDRDGVGGFTIYDVDLCITTFLREEPCDPVTESCAHGEVFCSEDTQCGEGLFCDPDMHRCERECGIITSRSQSLLDSLDRECSGSLKACDYRRGRCETVDIAGATCSVDQDCPSGAYCFLGQCEPRCFRSSDCPGSGNDWYCSASNTCLPTPRAASGGGGFDPAHYSVLFAQRNIALDSRSDRYEVPVLIMDLETKKQVFDDPNVLFGYRLEARYGRKQEQKCLGDLTQLTANEQADCIISPDEEFLTLGNPFGTLYATGDVSIALALNQGAVAKLSPGTYEATVSAIFNNGNASSFTVSFEKTSPSGEYLGQLSAYLDTPDNLLATTNLGLRLNVATEASKVEWDALLAANNVDQQKEFIDITRGYPVTGYVHGAESALFALPGAVNPQQNEIPVKGIYADQLGRMRLIAIIDMEPGFCRAERGECTPNDATDLEINNRFGRKVRRIVELVGPFDAKARRFEGMYRETISGLAPYDVTVDGGFRATQTKQDRAPITLGQLLAPNQAAPVGFPAVNTVLAAVQQKIDQTCTGAESSAKALFASRSAFMDYLAHYDQQGAVLQNLVRFESRLRDALSALGPSAGNAYITFTDYLKGQITFCTPQQTTNCVDARVLGCGLALHQKAILSGWIDPGLAVGEADPVNKAPLFCAQRAGVGPDCAQGAASAPTLVTLQEHNRFYRELAHTSLFTAGEAMSDGFYAMFKASLGPNQLDAPSAIAHKQLNLQQALASYDGVLAQFLGQAGTSVLFSWPMDAFQSQGAVWLKQMHKVLVDRLEAMTELFDTRRRLNQSTSEQDALFVDQVLQQEYLSQVLLAALQKKWQGDQFALAGESVDILQRGQTLLSKAMSTRNPLGLHNGRVFFENSELAISNWEHFRNRVQQQIQNVNSKVTDAVSALRSALASQNSLLTRLQTSRAQLDQTLDELCGSPDPLPPSCDVGVDERELASQCKGPDCLVEYQCDSAECDAVVQAFKNGAGSASETACRLDTRVKKVNIGSEERLCTRGRMGALSQEKISVELRRTQVFKSVRSLLRQISRQQTLMREAQQDHAELMEYLEGIDLAMTDMDVAIAGAELAFTLAEINADGLDCLVVAGLANGTNCPGKLAGQGVKWAAVLTRSAVVPMLQIAKESTARAKEMRFQDDAHNQQMRSMRLTLESMLSEVENHVAEYETLTQQAFNLDVQIQDTHALASRVAQRYQDSLVDLVDSLVGESQSAALVRNGLVQDANEAFRRLLVETYKMTQAFVHRYNASTAGEGFIRQVFELMTVGEVAAFTERLTQEASSYCAREGIDCDSVNNRRLFKFSLREELFPELRDVVDARTGQVLTAGEQFHNIITSSAFVKRRLFDGQEIAQIEIPFAVWANNMGEGAARRFMLPQLECNHILVGDRNGAAGTVGVNILGTRLGQGAGRQILYQLERGGTDYLRSCTERVSPSERKINTYTVGWSPQNGFGALDNPPLFRTRSSMFTACIGNPDIDNADRQDRANGCFNYFARDRSLAAPDWTLVIPHVGTDDTQGWLLGEGLEADERPIVEDIVLYLRHNARAIVNQ